MFKSIFIFLFAVSAQAHFGIDNPNLVPVNDGKLTVCSSANDAGKTGVFFKNLSIQKDEDSQWLRVTPLFVSCVAETETQAGWVEISQDEVNSQVVRDSEGNVFEIRTESRELVAQVHDVDSFVGQSYLSGDKNVAIDVRVFEYLKQRYEKEIGRSGHVLVPVDLAIRNTIAIYDNDGNLLDRYYDFSGWYRIQLSISQ